MVFSCNFFLIMLTLTVDTVLGSALSPLSVKMILFTLTGAISPVIVNVYTNGSVYTNGCYIDKQISLNLVSHTRKKTLLMVKFQNCYGFALKTIEPYRQYVRPVPSQITRA